MTRKLLSGYGNLLQNRRGTLGDSWFVDEMVVTIGVWGTTTKSRVATCGADSVTKALALGRNGTKIAVGDNVARLQMLKLHRLRLV